VLTQLHTEPLVNLKNGRSVITLDIASEKLLASGALTAKDLEALKSEVNSRVAKAIETVLASAVPSLDALLQHRKCKSVM